MLPTIQPDDMVLTEHISVTRRLIERFVKAWLKHTIAWKGTKYRNCFRGDVVISRSPSNPRQHICKRVIGLEGDIIRDPPPDYSFKYVILLTLKTIYTVVILLKLQFVLQVPKGHVWLQGDNSSNSTDSRSYGPVPYALIRSRVFYKVT